MYRVKAKPGRNVIINELGLSINYSSTSWIYIEKEKFDNSTEVQRIIKYLIVEDANSPIEEDKNDDSNKRQIIKVEENADVTEGHTMENPDDVFVASPEENNIEEIEDDNEKVLDNTNEITNEGTVGEDNQDNSEDNQDNSEDNLEELKTKAKELGVERYWLMKEETLKEKINEALNKE
ncbi:MAG: hypothetical protein ACOCRK_01350 [bacterium]